MANTTLANRTILITGGTGSFGQKFVEIALQYDPKEIRIFSRGWEPQEEMRRKFNNELLHFIIGDVRDVGRLYRATEGVDIVVHAAALKSISAAEFNPTECTATNISGTINVIDAASDNCVDKVVLISSDKAVQPLNLYGATKLIAEKLFIQANTNLTKFSCVRYGNVALSRGSVIPLWLEQKKSGRIEITDARMTRFWITLEEGVNFVIECLGRMVGGEIFIPKLPSVRIVDLADVVAPEAEKVIVGIRLGEKLHEVLITNEEVRFTDYRHEYFVIKSNRSLGDWSLPEDFVYSSDTNTEWLTKEQIRKAISE